MHQVKIFYGKKLAVEKEVNEFLTDLHANGDEFVDVKQSLDAENAEYIEMTVLYKL